ncbi:Cytochrome oxidase assembly [Entophlyctis luteolus]|nr:Cytochrome oxidase assembly [Entophlyctis luteolus]
MFRTLSKQQRHFVFFGLPFLATMVASTQVLASLMQTKFDLKDKKTETLSKEEALKLDTNRKKLDIQEEYFKLAQNEEQDWDMVRVPRPKGVDEPIFKKSA